MGEIAKSFHSHLYLNSDKILKNINLITDGFIYFNYEYLMMIQEKSLCTLNLYTGIEWKIPMIMIEGLNGFRIPEKLREDIRYDNEDNIIIVLQFISNSYKSISTSGSINSFIELFNFIKENNLNSKIIRREMKETLGIITGYIEEFGPPNIYEIY